MEGYSRYTTPKGQLILNIKSPSASVIPSSHSSVPTYPMQSKQEPVPVPKVLYAESRYRPEQSIQNRQFPISQPHHPATFYQNPNQNMQNINQYYNPNYRPYQQPNSSFHQPYIPQLQNLQPQKNMLFNQDRAPTTVLPQTYIQTYSIVEPTHLNHTSQVYSNGLTSNRSNQQKNHVRNTSNVDYHGLGDEDSENSEKRDKKIIDKTICCFPGYWLVLLLLLVVFATFFMILIKANKDLIADQQGHNNSTDTYNGGNNSSQSNNTTNNTNNNSNTQSNSTSYSDNSSSNENTSFQFPPQKTTTAPNSTNQKYKGQETSFMFPKSQHRHQMLRAVHSQSFLMAHFKDLIT